LTLFRQVGLGGMIIIMILIIGIVIIAGACRPS
jgi:hypothetical protein